MKIDSKKIVKIDDRKKSREWKNRERQIGGVRF